MESIYDGLGLNLVACQIELMQQAALALFPLI